MAPVWLCLARPLPSGHPLTGFLWPYIPAPCAGGRGTSRNLVCLGLDRQRAHQAARSKQAACLTSRQIKTLVFMRDFPAERQNFAAALSYLIDIDHPLLEGGLRPFACRLENGAPYADGHRHGQIYAIAGWPASGLCSGCLAVGIEYGRAVASPVLSRRV